MSVIQITNKFVEGIADYVRKPLLKLDSATLGADSATVEKRLREVLDLATLWNAIVLLDEADIFLEQRDTKNLERNCLVSGQ